MVSIKVILISALGLLGAVNAIPAPIPEPEIDYVNALIPGEGLPSPKELGLTNEDLTKPLPNGFSKRDNVLQKRYQCRFTDVCNLNDSRACFNYLLRLNERSCTATRRPTQFCRIGRCSWIGQAEGRNTASSYWQVSPQPNQSVRLKPRDVAHGGNTVNNRCRLGPIVGGYNYAGGNGYLRVTIAGN
ncbi:hypothetical protein TWF718_008400 [Orbilia javanica]|uniref:Uncharacterized protein n=1 Tax=Orbilia javanica TaxID=47235 RepID=A0AAN8N5A5_9PEZI